jgi:hypothetical protein
MKKTVLFVLLAAMLAVAVVPANVSAKDGELLVQVDFLKDTFVTYNQETDTVTDFKAKFDLSNSTANMLMPMKKAGVSDTVWNAALSYVEHTGYYVTEDTKYTIYFEVGDVHHGKWFGIPLLYEFGNQSVIMIGGAMADNGEFDDETAGTKYSQVVIAYDRPDTAHNVGEGYNEHGWLFYHPAITTDVLVVPDTCDAEETITEALFTTIKVEIFGTSIIPYYLNASNEFVKMSEVFTYDTEFGAEIILGTYAREGMRHNVLRNVKLLQGTGLTLADITTAKQTTEPKPARPEAQTTAAPVTQAPETQAPDTQAPDTQAPESQAPETQAPGTQAPATQAPETEPAKKGCAGALALMPVAVSAAFGVFAYRRRRH